MSAMAIGIFSVIGCVALLALRYVKSNTKQPSGRIGAAVITAAEVTPTNATK